MRVFNFRKDDPKSFDYLKDIYLVLMVMLFISSLSLLLEQPKDFAGYYVTFFYFGLGAIYWTPEVQNILNFDNLVKNYLLFLSQFIFIGNLIFIAILIARSVDRRIEKSQKGENNSPDVEVTIKDDSRDSELEGEEESHQKTLNSQENKSTLTSENTEINSEERGTSELRENLEILEHSLKDGLVYQISWLRLFATVVTLGIWSLKGDRWSKEEVDELEENILEKLPEKEKIYLSSSSEENLILVPEGKQLRLFEIDSHDIKISEHKNIDFQKVKDEEKYNSYLIKDRKTKEKIVELHFKDKESLDEFLEDLDSELNDHGLYYYNGIWDEEETVKEMARADIGLKNNFQNLSPYEFEDFVADLFERMGYTTKVTSKSGDFGVDVIAENRVERIAIQVKRHKLSNKVGAPTVQKTLGSIHKANANKTMIVTTSHFTGPAKEQARDGPIELWDKNILHNQVEKFFIQIN